MRSQKKNINRKNLKKFQKKKKMKFKGGSTITITPTPTDEGIVIDTPLDGSYNDTKLSVENNSSQEPAFVNLPPSYNLVDTNLDFTKEFGLEGPRAKDFFLNLEENKECGPYLYQGLKSIDLETGYTKPIIKGEGYDKIKDIFTELKTVDDYLRVPHVRVLTPIPLLSPHDEIDNEIILKSNEKILAASLHRINDDFNTQLISDTVAGDTVAGGASNNTTKECESSEYDKLSVYDTLREIVDNVVQNKTNDKDFELKKAISIYDYDGSQNFTKLKKIFQDEFNSTFFNLRLLQRMVTSLYNENRYLVFKTLTPGRINGCWVNDKQLINLEFKTVSEITSSSESDGKRGLLMMGLGPSASGKTHFARKLVENKTLKENFHPFLTIDGGLIRECSTAYQLVLNYFQSKGIKMIKNLKYDGLLGKVSTKQSKQSLFNSEELKDPIRDYLIKQKETFKFSLYVPETTPSIKKINKFGACIREKNGRIPLALICIFQCKDSCKFSDPLYKCLGCKTSGKKREICEGKIYSGQSYGLTLPTGLALTKNPEKFMSIKGGINYENDKEVKEIIFSLIIHNSGRSDGKSLYKFIDKGHYNDKIFSDNINENILNIDTNENILNIEKKDEPTKSEFNKILDAKDFFARKITGLDKLRKPEVIKNTSGGSRQKTKKKNRKLKSRKNRRTKRKH